MFLSRDSLPASSPEWVECYEKINENLAKRTRELKQANRELANQIAQRERTEAALREAEQRYRSIFENAVVGIFQSTLDGCYLACNPKLASIYGYESTEQLLATLTDIGRQLYVSPIRRQEFVEQLYAYGAVSEFESQVYRKDGSVIWISESARAVQDEQGNWLYYEGFVADISQRKAVEEALRNSEAELRIQAEELEQALTKLQETQSHLIQHEKMSCLGQLVAGVAHEIKNPVNFVCNNLIPASQYTEDLLSLLQLYFKHYPQPVVDIQAKAEAIDLEFLIEDFPKTLASMQVGADRIRQIVQSLQNFSRLDEAEMKPVDLHQGLDSTLLILHNRLKSQGDNPGIVILKDYGELPLVECYAGLLNQVFMNLLCNAVDALEDGHQKQYKFGCCEDSATALAKQDEYDNLYPLVSAEGRLVSEATLKYLNWLPSQKDVSVVTESTLATEGKNLYPSTIWIRTEVKKNPAQEGNPQDFWVIIRIIDNGPGMTEDVRKRIFDPFFTTKPMGKGTGLGLAISYQIIVEKHGGNLRCISAPNQGTEFVIEIPIRRQLS